MTTAPILTTKLFVPPVRTSFVKRPRLVEQIAAGSQSPLTLISAPAGFGKSMLLSEWINSSETERARTPGIAWLSLDKDDNDDGRIWQYILAALERLRIESLALASVSRLIQSQVSLPVEYLLTELINSLAGCDRDIVLVLDDYHLIQNQGIHDGIIFLVEHLPPQMHLVLSTRVDPPMPLGRWRSRGLMVEIRSADLRFTEGEAEEFLNHAMALGLAEWNIAELETRTEGWIAGLQMAAISLRNQPKEAADKFIQGFSGRHHFILDYLTDEVLKRQPEATQQLLLSTSILAQFCAPLCDAVLSGASTNTAELLEELEHANLFIIPLDSDRNWYRYHHLFAELLRVRLKEQHPGWIPGLHRRATAWYEENGFPFEAMHHALAAQDSNLAADVIERTVRKPTTWSTGNIARMLEALNALPEEIVASRPWLRVYISGVVYVSGRLSLADQMLAQVEETVPAAGTSPVDQAQLLLHANVYRAYYASVRGDVAAAMERSQKALAGLPPDDQTVSGHALAAMGKAYALSGDVSKAASLLEQAVSNQKRKKAWFTGITWLSNLAEVQIVQGQLRQAVRTCDEAASLGITGGEPSPTVGLTKVFRGAVLYEWNRLDEADKDLRTALSLMQAGGIIPVFGQAHAVLAMINQAQGNQKEADLNIQIARQVAQNSQLARYMALVSAFQARLWLARGDLDQALQWAESHRRAGIVEYLREFEDLVLARVLFTANLPAEAAAVLDGVVASAEPAGRSGRVIEALALRALTFSNIRLGNAQDDLIRALRLAEPEDYQRVFIDFGEPMAILLNSLPLPQGALREYRDRLLAGFTVGPAEESPVGGPPDQASLVEPLSERELEILRLVAIGLPNAKIAQRLFLAENTIRAHTSHIFGKLGVHNRTEAVSRARELGLI